MHNRQQFGTARIAKVWRNGEGVAQACWSQFMHMHAHQCSRFGFAPDSAALYQFERLHDGSDLARAIPTTYARRSAYSPPALRFALPFPFAVVALRVVFCHARASPVLAVFQARACDQGERPKRAKITTAYDQETRETHARHVAQSPRRRQPRAALTPPCFEALSATLSTCQIVITGQNNAFPYATRKGQIVMALQAVNCFIRLAQCSTL